jgi:hypothetical protein
VSLHSLSIVCIDTNQLWLHRDGDALARLCALGATAYTLRDQQTGKGHNHKITVTPTLEKLCVAQSLRQTSVTRSLELCNQLKRVLVRVLNNSSTNIAVTTQSVCDEGPWNVLEPPRADEAVKLRQIMTSAYIDCIARKAPLGTVKTGSRRRRLTAYISCDGSISEPIYIHPHSNLYQKDPSASHPEFVVYSELIKNLSGDCTYMSCVTAINGLWIPHLTGTSPLLQLSQPLESPAPHFDAALDCVLCHVVPSFGIHKWEFPALKRPMAHCFDQANPSNSATNSTSDGKKWTNVVGFRKQDECYRWFARLLLEGQVIQFTTPAHQAIWKKSNLKESPSIITSMKPVTHVSTLLQKLINHNILSSAALRAFVVQSNGSFLCEEIEKFLQVESRKTFRKAWASIC